jgi:DNA invertase Pin-like site-specific DNA recombinase
MATLLLSVMEAFAEFERSLIREGNAIAKQRGAYKGRKRLLSAEQVGMLRERVTASEQKAKLAREVGISRETIYPVLARES